MYPTLKTHFTISSRIIEINKNNRVRILYIRNVKKDSQVTLANN